MVTRGLCAGFTGGEGAGRGSAQCLVLLIGGGGGGGVHFEKLGTVTLSKNSDAFVLVKYFR